MNSRYSFLLLSLAALALVLVLTPTLHAAAPATTARTPKSSGPATKTKASEKDAKKPKTIAEVVGTNKKFEGLFTLYQDKTNGTVHLLVKQAQLGKEFIY